MSEVLREYVHIGTMDLGRIIFVSRLCLISIGKFPPLRRISLYVNTPGTCRTMACWKLLAARGELHLINLDADVAEVPGLGRFRTAALRDADDDATTGGVAELAGIPVRLLDPTLPDLERALARGPQVVLPRDLAWLAWTLALEPGDTVVEAGGGSGGLTLALARAVAPDGCVITHEPNARHRAVLERNIARSRWAALVEVRAAELAPATDPECCAAVVLDLPRPWELAAWAAASLAPGGRIAAYVPTTPQVARLLTALAEDDGWQQVAVVENLQREWEPRPEALRPRHSMLGHTGFIVSARWVG